ncbi:MAG: ribosome recycling factor [Christensenellaceae bacterium]|nr:ribosome recycling factor [Christensenellaceae bacterium]
MAYEIIEVELGFDELRSRCEKSIVAYKNELLNMKAGRANAHLLDKILVNYYDTPTHINQMANITIPEARLMQIAVWDASAIKKVEKAIIDANIGLTPSNDGKVIRLVFPELTEERRRALVKDIKVLAENAKVALRNARRDLIELLRLLKKDSTVTEDELKVFERDTDKEVAEFISIVDKTALDKEKEIMNV